MQLNCGLRIDVDVSAAIVSHTPAVGLHPTLQVAAVSHKGHVAEYDLISGTKLGSSEVGNPPVALHYTPDASTLLGITQDFDLVAWDPLLWRRKVLARLPFKAGYLPQLDVSEGSAPTVLVYTQSGREMALIQTGNAVEGAAKEKQNIFSVKKAIVAAQLHPADPNIVICLHQDSTLTANSLNVAQHSVTELWQHSMALNAASIAEGLLAAYLAGRDGILLLCGLATSLTALTISPGGPPIEVLNWKGSGRRVTGAAFHNGLIECYTQTAAGDVGLISWQTEAIKGSRLAVQELNTELDSGPTQAAQPARTPKAWEQLWQPKVGVANSSQAASQVLAHSSGAAVIVTKNREHVSLVPVRANSTQALACKNQPSTSVLHTEVQYWHGTGEGVIKTLEVESPVYYLERGLVKGYSLLDGSAQIETPDVPMKAVHLVHSAKQALAIVFFDAGLQKGSAECPGVFTAFSTAAEALKPQKLGWTLPGTSAVFVGMEEDHYAVLCKQQVILYAASAGFQKPARGSRAPKGPEPPALKKISLGPSPLAIFAGPAWSRLPRSGEEEELSYPGNGLIMWSTPDHLGISELSSDRVIHRSTSNRGLAPAHTLALLPQESVLQVAWQNLLTGVEGAVLDDTGEGKASVVGAVLTDRRVLLVSATLSVLVAFGVSAGEPSPSSLLWAGPALLFTTSANQVKQLSWDGSVAQVCSIGGAAAASLIAALPDRLLLLRSHSNGSSFVSERQIGILEPLLQGWASLAAMGVLPGGVWRARAEMGKLLRIYEGSKLSSSLFNSLLTAGCGDVALALARSSKGGPMSGGQEAAMRAAAGEWQDAVQNALKDHKASLTYPRAPAQGSKLWRRLVILGRTALAYGQIGAARECWQAAGHWQQLLPLCALQGDFSAIRAYIANAPSEAKQMGEQLLSASQARFTKAAAVGAQATLGDWKVSPEVQTGSLAAGVAAIALELPSSSAAPTVEVRQRGTDIVTPLPHLEANKLEAFVGVGATSSWDLPAKKSRTTDKSPFIDSFTSAVPNTPSSGTDEAPKPAPVDLSALHDNPFDALAGPQASQTSTVPATPSSTGLPPISGGKAQASPGATAEPPPLLGSFDSFSTQASKKTPPKKLSAKASKDDFYSSDSDEAASENTFSTAPSKRQFKIVIRDKSENVAGGGDLKMAASALKRPNLAPPMGPPRRPSLNPSHASGLAPAGPASSAGPSDWGFPSISVPEAADTSVPGFADFSSFDPFAISSPPSTSAATPSISQEAALPAGRGALPEDLFSEAPPAPPPDVRPTPAPPKSVQPNSGTSQAQAAIAPSLPATSKQPVLLPENSDPKASFEEGIKAMESGQWEESAVLFRMAILGSKDASHIERSAHYMAAVLLLDAQGDNARKDARLSRFAAALPLQDRHKRALVQQAAQKNMDARNFGYAADQLMWLITTSVQAASPATLAALQDKLTECEQKGTTNADLPRDEDLQAFPTIVGLSRTAVDVEDSLKGIV